MLSRVLSVESIAFDLVNQSRPWSVSADAFGDGSLLFIDCYLSLMEEPYGSKG